MGKCCEGDKDLWQQEADALTSLVKRLSSLVGPESTCSMLYVQQHTVSAGCLYDSGTERCPELLSKHCIQNTTKV